MALAGPIFTFIFLHLMASVAFALLPLPYPLVPPDEELEVASSSARDPKSVQGYFELHRGSALREMELPQFGTQIGVLGYEPGKTFTVPKELRSRVDFWIKIFTEYTSDQTVLHDSDYPEIVFDVLDISQFTNDNTISYRAQRRKINKFLKSYKKKIVDTLLFLHTNRDEPLKIPLEHFSLFRKYEKISNPYKFLEATQRIRAQVGQRNEIVRGFFFGGRYFKKMMDILEAKKLPKELTRLPLVESAFNLSARSKVGASGVWQFMRSTGKRFLRIDKFVDERNDPILATRAAGELLKKNYEKLGSWGLAITAYNHGRSGMSRASEALKTQDIGVIIEHYKGKTFGFASANFYAEFLAILEVEREYRKHFGKLTVDTPVEFDEFPLNDNVMFEEMADICSMSEEELAVLNPALMDLVVSGKAPIPQGFRLKVFTGRGNKCRSGYLNVTKYHMDSDRWIASDK